MRCCIRQVDPNLIDGNGKQLSDGVCVILTAPQTLALVNTHYWPGTDVGHTHTVSCSVMPPGPLANKQPQRLSWHGPSSFCAWKTGALAFVEGADDAFELVSCHLSDLFAAAVVHSTC